MSIAQKSKPSIVNLKTQRVVNLKKYLSMRKRILIYVGFFIVLLRVFYLFLFQDYDFSKSQPGSYATTM